MFFGANKHEFNRIMYSKVFDMVALIIIVIILIAGYKLTDVLAGEDTDYPDIIQRVLGIGKYKHHRD